MDDFTKTKLINNLIDLVSHFYELKHKEGTAKQVRYLKGFSEGIAFTLVEANALQEKEAKTILKGLGKKREYTKPKVSVKEEMPVVTEEKNIQQPLVFEQEYNLPTDSLDVPTIFRKHSNKKEL